MSDNKQKDAWQIVNWERVSDTSVNIYFLAAMNDGTMRAVRVEASMNKGQLDPARIMKLRDEIAEGLLTTGAKAIRPITLFDYNKIDQEAKSKGITGSYITEGESIGRYMDHDIPAYIMVNDVKHEYEGVFGKAYQVKPDEMMYKGMVFKLFKNN